MYQLRGVPVVLVFVLRLASIAGSSLKGSFICGVGAGGVINSSVNGAVARVVQPGEVQPVVQPLSQPPHFFLQQPLLQTKIESSKPGKRRWQQLVGGIVFGYGQQCTVRAHGLHLLGQGLKRANTSTTLSTRLGSSGGMQHPPEEQPPDVQPPLQPLSQPVEQLVQPSS